ncbi:hypothetical protein [Lactobacillus sp. ESL0677]|uniref:hypothetical protein n=1 Tax=Lactobacillus sp. ESL0677 TaxID=2983208 RepID=UPI0023F71698|nr:hypothetical protein [Lactobacillus sp. ESL0677]WEV37920.1 hypothetical protein OZX76_05290 [Lactobacillus sp. ESL0677]
MKQTVTYAHQNNIPVVVMIRVRGRINTNNYVWVAQQLEIKQLHGSKIVFIK